MTVSEALVAVAFILGVCGVAIVGLFTHAVDFFWAVVFVAVSLAAFDATAWKGRKP